MMRPVAALRSVVTLTVAVLLLWLLASRGLIEMRPLVDAARQAPGTLLLIGLLLLGPLVLGSLRYHMVLRAMGKHVPFTSILAASCVSGAVSNWTPASAGVMEVLRFGLLVRSTGRSATDVSRTDLAVVGLVDRLLGLATVAVVGLAGSAYILAPGRVAGTGVRVILMLTLLLGGACALPFIAVRTPRLDHALGRVFIGAPGRFLSRIVAALRQVDQRSSSFALALVCSMGISLVTIVAVYLSMRLFAPSTTLLVVAVALPPISIASLVPASFAGFGGNQAAAAVIFKALAIDPGAAALASLLFFTTALVVSSVAGVVCAPIAWHRTPPSHDGAIRVEKASAE